jgi:hypothetical protein
MAFSQVPDVKANNADDFEMLFSRFVFVVVVVVVVMLLLLFFF